MSNTDPAIIEAAERALEEWDSYQYPELARAAIAAATPLIRAAALEEAAKVAEDDGFVGQEIAVRIRALKPTSPSPSDDSA